MSKPTFMLSRRQCLKLAAVCGLAASPLALSNRGRQEYWLSAEGASDAGYGLAWLTAGSGNVSAQPSGFRGHAVVAHPLKPATALFIGRRPSTTVLEVDLRSGEVSTAFECAAQRHLFGHGCFSGDGKVLFTTETNYQTGQGKIGLRDSLSYGLIGEFESYGIGPHELKLMPDMYTLVVANGGILTHPETGRAALNLAAMNSNLSYINSLTGDLVDQYTVSEPKASIRHLDVAPDGTVALAMQLQREASDHNRIVALAGVHRANQAIALLDAPKTLLLQLNDYLGSVAINHRSRIAGFTSPKGNLVSFWHIDSLQFKGHYRLHDVCGIANSVDQQHFIITSSAGHIRHLDARSLREDQDKRLHFPNRHWDNHLTVATL